MNIPPKYEDVVAKLDSANEEINCLKSVLNGMEFQNVDGMVLDGADACLFLGQESARIIKGIQSERNELREELDRAKSRYDREVLGLNNEGYPIGGDPAGGYKNDNARLQQRLTVAEQRNTSITGKVSSCKDCGSSDLFWFAQNTVKNGIQQNRLNTHDVQCVFFLGCNHCSATLKQVSADTIAEKITAALKPAAEWEGS